MTLDDLKVFAEVCRVRNLSAVARDMGCSQSAVSQHVRRLEKETGVSLVERQARGIVPTVAGDILNKAAVDGLAALNDALRLLNEMRTGHRGSIAIATGATTIRHFMGAAVKEFRRQFPDVTLEFHTERSSERCLKALRNGEVDLAWVTVTSDIQGVEQRAVIDLEWVLAVRHDDPLAGEAALSADTLPPAHLIRPPSSTSSGRQVERHLGPDPTAQQAPTSATDWDTALLLAELGLGHALVPSVPGLTGHGGDELRLVPVTGMSPLRVGWAVRQWSALSPMAEQFAATVTAHLGRS